MAGQNLSFGVLLLPNFQWLDACGPVDYINNHSQAMLKFLQQPDETISKGPIITWHYISTDLMPVRASSGPLMIPSTTYADCPPLDYLIVPGPDPTVPLPEACSAFLKAHFPELRNLLLVCTASMAVAQTGILDGLQVCTNKMALKMVAQAGMHNRNVKWVRDRRWVVDGKVWSSAGVTSGLDMAVEFAKVMFDPVPVALTREMLEYQAREAQPDPFAYILEGFEL
ncbi:hypothetical protein NLJ89_g8758 [Agrocybe chaxingu]|uniref:DJ-1/PfpI domain-containing protein n=1 Tax=Agrocybe chaxingu TaxID=84603 RepID=A0A9W8JTT1_9AGAR|nr:hypothetical protein NLJ89_g8758 [Agrocybe chaxingu]